MRKISFIILTFLFPLCLSAQEEWELLRGGCLPDGLPQQSYANGVRLSAPRRLPAINNQWDATKTYHQLVLLVEFVDQSFNCEDPLGFYNRMLNEPGYNEGAGAGCMADYFRVQSDGLFNVQFDVYGPYVVSQKAQPYDNPDGNTKNYGKESFREAVLKFLGDSPDIDFSKYDWDDDNYVNQVIFVYAGVPGNLGSKTYGHIWPNSSSITTVNTPDGKIICNYSASAEVWPTTTPRSCGFGTVSHEFGHSLGLPDIYPTNGWCYSICDEWDLMDGGNVTNYGWCPANFTPLEKMLLGWLTPIELTEAESVCDLPAVSENGSIFQIRHSDTEYLLLENRQQTNWDAGVPGHGLMVWYVNYDESAWRNNVPNNVKNAPRFHPVYADGLDYVAWTNKVVAEGLSTYQNSNRMNKRHLSTSPYPFVTEETTVDAIVEEYLTNIQETADGLVSFDFKGGVVGIKQINASAFMAYDYYDLHGRRVNNPQQDKLYIVRTPKGIRKQLCR